MKKLSPEEAIAILNDMKIDIPVPKAAVTQRKRNVALDMAIEALSSSEIPNSSDTISRQQAIDICRAPHMRNADCSDFEMAIMMLPPAQPAPSQVAADIARIVENGKDMRVIEAAQPTPDQNGDLWITVPDIDEVTCIYVQESKSKFCRIFYEER